MGVGAYFSMSFTEIELHDSHELSKTAQKKIVKASEGGTETVKAYLLGQIGKDDSLGKELKLENLMEYVLSIVSQAQDLIAGRVLLLECSDCAKLQQRYHDVGFVDLQTGENGLLQMYKIV